MKIVVLAGGLSPERNVSLSSGTMIAEALRSRGHRAALVDLYFGLEDYNGPTEAYFDAPLSGAGRRVQREAPDLEQVKAARKWKGKSQFGPGVLELCALADVVFLALHGQCGEDGRVQAAFDLMGIPYTGAGYLGSALAMDKDLTKRLISGLGVDTPKWRTVRYTEADVDRLTSTTPAPCVVKPVDSGSSIGVSIAHDKKELHAALLEGLRFLRRREQAGLAVREEKLIRRLGEGLSRLPGTEVYLAPRDSGAQSGVLSFRVRDRDCEELGELLGRRGIALRAGLHCAPLAHRTAGTLESGTLRASVSAFTLPEEIGRALAITEDLLREEAV